MSKLTLEKKINCTMARISRLDRNLVQINKLKDHIEEELLLVRQELEEYRKEV